MPTSSTIAARWRHVGLAALAVTGLAGPGLTGTTAAAAPPSGLQVTTIVSGLSNPWDAAFTPGGTMLFTERAGTINYVGGGQRRQLAAPSDVVVNAEGGMMGIAVDPDFQNNRRIYTCFMSDRSGPIDIRVVRWRMADGASGLTNRKSIVTGIPVNTAGQLGRHSGCRLAFGPGGALWITTGDAATGRYPQDRQSLAGKVLRVDTSGKGHPDNPGGSFHPKVYAYGFRNPQGIAFRPGGKVPFIVEHGPSCDDEITRIRSGGNGGWAPGGGNDYFENVSMTDTSLPNVMNPSWRSGCPTIAPSGGNFITDPDWGSWRGDLAVAVLKDQHLRLFTIAGDGSTGGGRVVLTGQGRLRQVVQAPSGRVYVLTDSSSGRILRIDPVS